MNKINNLIKLNKEILFDIPSEYKNDIVNYKDIKEYSKKLKEYSIEHRDFCKRASKVDYSNIENNLIKQELQYCFYVLSTNNDNYKFFTLKTKILNKYIIPFFNKYSLNYSTILDDNIYNDYENYIIDLGRKIKENGKKYINIEMEQIVHNHIPWEISIFKKCIEFVDNYCVENIKEYDKDIWNVEKLNIKVINAETSRIKTINFTNIKQEKVKSLVKKYVYFRLKTHPIKTAVNDLNEIKKLSTWLLNNHKEINSLENLNRQIIEKYFAWIRCESNLSKEAVLRNIGCLKNFFNTINLCNFPDIPKQTLIISSDYSAKNTKHMVIFYTDDEIQLMNKNLSKLPLQYGRLLFIIENISMRSSEIRGLKINCLKENDKGDYYLTYYQVKTKKFNCVPINETVAKVIKAAIKETKEKFGENVEYIFTSSGKNPIASTKLSDVFNSWTLENNLIDLTGKPIRIVIQKFRGTVATKYINLGLDIDVLRKMLGHSSGKAIYHYIEIHNDTLLSSVKPIIDMQESLISNIGNIKQAKIEEKENKKDFISLSNGKCCRPLSEGVCKHANACLTCKMFKYDKTYLQLYEMQLKEIYANIEIAKVNNFERILEYNLELKTNLEKIINKIKGE